MTSKFLFYDEANRPEALGDLLTRKRRRESLKTIGLFLTRKLLRINTLEGNPQVGLKLFQPSLKSSLVARTI